MSQHKKHNFALYGLGAIIGVIVGLILMVWPIILGTVFIIFVKQRELAFNELLLSFCFVAILFVFQFAIIDKVVNRKARQDASGNNRG